MTKRTYHIPDMHCSSCAMRLEGLEDTLDGISSIKASYQKQILEVVFDEMILVEEKLISAIRSLGYTPS